MPVVDIPFPDPREPDRVVSGKAWSPRITIDAESESITVAATVYNSPAAYAANSSSTTFPAVVAGEEFRAVVRENPELWGLLAALADGLIASRLGGTVVPAPPPPWAVPVPPPEV